MNLDQRKKCKQTQNTDEDQERNNNTFSNDVPQTHLNDQGESLS